MAASPLIDRLNALAGEGRLREAAELLAGNADTGNPEALIELACWRIDGRVVRRDLAAARALLGRAGEGGRDDAALLHAYFAAAAVGGPPDWPAAREAVNALAARLPSAARQCELLEKMDLDELGFPAETPRCATLSEAPEIRTSAGFMTSEECAYLIDRAQPLIAPSTVVDPRTGQVAPHPIRRSDFASFGVFHEDLVVSALNRRLAALSGTAPEQGESLQVLRYNPGGEYRSHVDALPATDNQRIATALVYLNGDYDGGETRFERLGITFRGQPGDAIVFRNVTADGTADPMTQHAGLPVTRGTKFIASRWIRARRFVFPPPEPALRDF